MKPIVIGIFAAFFFAFTFVLNASMDATGGSWIWSAALRYIFMVPFLVAIVLARRNLKPLLKEMKKAPQAWLLWSFIGFGLFYMPLCFAAAYSPGWLIAGSWQITIIAGSLIAPFFFARIHTSSGPQWRREKIPYKGLMFSIIILLGVIIMQVESAQKISLEVFLLGFLPVMVACFAYPLGNRKMMELCDGRLDAYQRVLGMTLASLPFWFILSIYGVSTVGVPSISQSLQSLIVAISSGVIATVLFFKATDLVRKDMKKLAAVEATQSLEVLFALAGEIIILSIALPSPTSWIGIIVVMLGMIIHSQASIKRSTSIPEKIIDNPKSS
ncbi:multidrug resistance efflux transporter family protein [Planomicrobium sp. CPCC 101110]|uniref:DMT family transporter n=1 Tax=Planomicrobium sp. CPCC 101110 TaxID=2599619 RepID=UPI0011B59191|nr:multidrug resistance efflux transporter family protein [Planomicrobium sp. CPCC 101110]TWT26446.1 multidrug resistance efflux transporter family protein [Planomicrobium sp. CPCC 101110]